jgi:hypothetical protein
MIINGREFEILLLKIVYGKYFSRSSAISLLQHVYGTYCGLFLFRINSKNVNMSWAFGRNPVTNDQPIAGGLPKQDNAH